MSNKRAQATILVIIAIIIGTVIMGAYYTNEYVLKSKFEREQEIASLVPTQAQKVYDFTINCLEETANQAIDLVGLQGGYISIEHNSYDSPVLETPQTKTAFWFFEAPNKIQKTNIPTKERIQEEISVYIDDNLDSCINSYQDFPEFEIEQGEVTAETIIKANQVLVKADLPLIIRKQDFDFEFKPFYTEIKKPLGYLYDQAFEILQTENTQNFLEIKTIDILASHEEIPFRGSTEDCNAPFWLTEAVTQQLRDALQLNIGFLKVKDTNYQLSNSEHKYFEIPTSIDDKELNVNFQYLKSWPTSIEIFPEKDGILKSESLTSSLGSARAIAESFMCLSAMNFIYNIKYPVLINLNKEDYNFRFITETIIDKNEPKLNTETIESPPETNTKYCENKINNLNIEVLDQNSNPIEDAEVSYKCINYVCDLGLTNNEGNLNTKTIPCVNGAVISTKKGYHPTKFTTSTNTDINIQIQLQAYKSLNIIPQIQRAGSGELRENEQIIIQMQNPENEHSVSAIYPEQQQINLIPGTYNTQIYLSVEHPEGIRINSKELEVCLDIPKKSITGALLQQTERKCETQRIDGFELDRVVSGSSEGQITISESDLLSNSIRFYIPYQGIPNSIDELNKITSDFTQPRFE